MPEIPVSALDDRQQRLVENARIALENGDTGYALDACGQVLRGAPACLPVRRLQRAAQLRRFETSNRLVRAARSALAWTASRFRGGAGPAERTFASAERMLEFAPTSVRALTMLARAAAALDLRETAVFALEAAGEFAPRDRATRLALGQALLSAGKPGAALTVADAILAERPLDPAAQDLMRAASIGEMTTQGRGEQPSGTLPGKLNEAPR